MDTHHAKINVRREETHTQTNKNTHAYKHTHLIDVIFVIATGEEDNVTTEPLHGHVHCAHMLGKEVEEKVVG